jgi:hypothetical protein
MANQSEAKDRALGYMNWAAGRVLSHPRQVQYDPGDQRMDGDAGELARNPSFDLGYPMVPGRDLEGVPNANDPVMREKLRQRLLNNPRGNEDLPGFVKKASASSPWQLL